MNLGIEIIGALCLLVGLFFLLVAGVGIWRLPDVYCRAHALGKALTLGVILLLLSIGLLLEGALWWKVGLAISFQLVTIPVASHLLCLIGYRRGMVRWSGRGWVRDGG
jgi:multicomponent Na+:H+ antiporter subunit G